MHETKVDFTVLCHMVVLMFVFLGRQDDATSRQDQHGQVPPWLYRQGRYAGSGATAPAG